MNTNTFFIDNFYENASQFNWEQAADGALEIQPITDHARFSCNSQFTHWNFKFIVPKSEIGKTQTVRFRPIRAYYNLEPNISFQAEKMATAICYTPDCADPHWERLAMEMSPAEGCLTEFSFVAQSTVTQIAHTPPYTLQDNDVFVEALQQQGCEVEIIGKTAEGRPLEIVTIGNADAPYRVFVRARAHSWESGGSWVLEGIVAAFTADTPEGKNLRENICLYIMPMANKDGVARGLTRFTTTGMDLNRHWDDGWDEMAPYMPENVCLRNWLDKKQAEHKLPMLAFCLHNDSDGKIHFMRPEKNAEAYWERMRNFVTIFEKNSWFCEGSLIYNSYVGAIGDGLIAFYGIDTVVYEMNCDWAEGLQRAPLIDDWKTLGQSLAKTLLLYFKQG